MIFHKIIAKKETLSITVHLTDKNDDYKKRRISFSKIKKLKTNDFIEKKECVGYRITMLFQDKQGLLIEYASIRFGRPDSGKLIELLPPSLIYYQKKENKTILKEDVDIQVEEEKPAITLYGTNRSQHSPRDEKYTISYTTLKEMEVGEEITWSTENDGYEVKVIFSDKDGALVRITQYDNLDMGKEQYVKLKYFEWID